MKNLIKTAIINPIVSAIDELKIRKYKGEDVECPLCHSTFKIFAPAGLKNRPNARCHHCGSKERHRLSWLYMNQRLDVLNSDRPVRFLHFAPEKTFYQVFASLPNLDYVPADLEADRYHKKGYKDVVKVDITNIPFQDNSFDFILCNHVLEHIPDDATAMSELFRVLKSGGGAILQVPLDYSRDSTYEDFSITSPEEREKAFGQKDHVRWYGKDYKDRLEKAGFKVTVDDFIHSFSKNDQFKYGLEDDELIYYCKK